MSFPIRVSIGMTRLLQTASPKPNLNCLIYPLILRPLSYTAAVPQARYRAPVQVLLPTFEDRVVAIAPGA